MSLTDLTFRARVLPDITDQSVLNQSYRHVDWRTGVVVPKARRSKVAIVGGGDSAIEAPMNDHAWEVWGVNGCVTYCRDANRKFRADRWFELHDLNERVCKNRRPKGYAKWLKQFGRIPLYQFHGRKDAPCSVQYPLDRVVRVGRDYFGCTFAYQVALAIAEGFTTIGLYGAALVTGREALVERPTVEWWLGFATGRDIEVIVPSSYSEGTGRHAFRYAYDQVAERDAAYDYCAEHLQNNAAYIASRGRGFA